MGARASNITIILEIVILIAGSVTSKRSSHLLFQVKGEIDFRSEMRFLFFSGLVLSRVGTMPICLEEARTTVCGAQGWHRSYFNHLRP